MQGRKRIAGAMGVLLLASTALAQFRMAGGSVSGVWFPEVGSGSVYEMQVEGRKTSMTVAIVGKEDFKGRPGYWLETSMQSEKGVARSKMLMVSGADNKLDIARMIFQMGPQVYEMDPAVMHRNPQQQSLNQDIRKTAQHVGTETITTPAGTFTCEHWRDTKTGGDVWISDKIAPWGLVKSENKTESTVLVQRLTGVKSKITGTPVIFDPSQMRPPQPQKP